MGVFRTKPVHRADQFYAVNDEKLRLTLMALTDRYSAQIRRIIYNTYNDDKLLLTYRAIRMSGIYEHGGKTKVRRKLIEFPNAYVADFVNTTMTALHGPQWMESKRHFRHELIAPWLVVEKL